MSENIYGEPEAQENNEGRSMLYFLCPLAWPGLILTLVANICGSIRDLLWHLFHRGDPERSASL